MKGDQLELPDLLKLAGLVGVPMILVMIQPDLGTALTFVPILAVGRIFGGVSLAVCGGDPGDCRRDSADQLLAWC